LGALRNLGARYPSWPYVAPFGTFLLLLALGPRLGASSELHYPVRVVVVTAVLLLWSRPLISLRPARPLQSVMLGVLVFAIWIGPDILWPGYRSHWLFQNAFLGASSSVTNQARSSLAFVLWRMSGLVLLVPIVEELFWRAWMMRYIMARDFESIPLGTYSALAFWATAVLFASEHGPYWDVGLAAGVAYNWWMVRTRSLGDCILAHAVTNACLGGYVLAAGRWEYLL
jgi:CAAX prenyl protease-like protein